MTKDFVSFISGALGGLVVMAFGGWSEGLTTLLIFMIVDYITGLAVAGIFKSSPKTETGALESKAGWKGLCRKVLTLILVMLTHRVDILFGTTYFMGAATIGFIVNEAISIVENAGLMGLPIPAAITNMVDALKKRAEQKPDFEDEDEEAER